MGGWRWLKWGLHLKRWVLAIAVGLIFLVTGAICLGLGIFDLDTAMPDTKLPLSPYGAAVILILLGMILVFTGIYRLVRRIEKLLKRTDESRGLAEIAYHHNRLQQGPKIVCLGGGTGLSTILRGLKEYTQDITAVVSVADDGGSSGRLRLDFDMLPPGDIRNCLVALADAGPGMSELMQYRFDEGEFSGHSFGNLFITVLARIRGDFGLAVREANSILSVRGRVLPATLDKVSLVATHDDGTKTTGQKNIAKTSKPIEELSLKPNPGEPPQDVIDAIAAADLIIVGPGSLFTSVLPNLLDTEILKAINQSKAQVYFVVNTMGQAGETQFFKVSDHIKSLMKHAPGLRIDKVIVNSYRPSMARLKPLEEENVTLTEYDRKEVQAMGLKVLLRDVIDLDEPARHNPYKLAAMIVEAWKESEK
ncbi:MAG: uridine diphosphate-N-acetylglucosamine-binding protein YvcK [Planctomycetes bacterium]|nr:uridine diphosphate-N-acetylglucosamine-binding protein YvcK [Planctomycetota bacterium]